MSCICRFIEQDTPATYNCEDHGRVDQWGQSITTRKDEA